VGRVNAHTPHGKIHFKITALAAVTTALALSASSGGTATAQSTGSGLAPSASAHYPRNGARGIGDPYFPHMGNGGYDALHYHVVLDYRRNRSASAVVTMTARATQDLSGLSLDFRGPKIKEVEVDDRRATFQRRGQDLLITPAVALRRGQVFTVRVRYAGGPGSRTDKSLGTYGWIRTRDGVVTLSQPDGTPAWMPVNDHPLDKATYTFRVTVPKGLTVIANGRPSKPVHRAKTSTYTWSEPSPMASYLALVAIGKFKVTRSEADGIPVITAVDPRYRRHAARLHRSTKKALAWLSKTFGPYPFTTAGGVIDDPKLKYALETQSRPVYAGITPRMNFIVHEMAHQWFGNSVSLKRWQDIWLNEGLASYAEWLWREQHRGKSAEQIFRSYYKQPASSAIFSPPPGRPGRNKLFGDSVYIRGAMTVHALRKKVGDRTFFRILRAWTTQYRHGNAGTADFIALAEKESGKQLDQLFKVWLYSKGKPKKW